MSEYKYIQLTNGDHLFTALHFPENKTGFLKLKQPLKLSMKEDDHHIQFGFMPWIPFSDDEVIPLSAKAIVTIANLNDEYIELYKKGVNHRTNTENVLDLDDPNIPNVLLN